MIFCCECRHLKKTKEEPPRLACLEFPDKQIKLDIEGAGFFEFRETDGRWHKMYECSGMEPHVKTRFRGGL